MSSLWAAYGRIISNLPVGLLVTVAVMATNVGIILGSKMWAAPLESDINKLWINPASQIYEDNKYVENFGDASIETGIETFTLDGGGVNVASPPFVAEWMELNRRILGTVVVDEGVPYTFFDVCSPKYGQSAYTFGCTALSSFDFFLEGQDFNPSQGGTQFLLDFKLALNQVIPPLFNAYVAALTANTMSPTPATAAALSAAATKYGTAVGTSWFWAFSAEGLLQKMSILDGPITSWFALQCQVAPYFLCIETGTTPSTQPTGANVLYDAWQQFIDLAPTSATNIKLKMNYGFAKAQMLTLAMAVKHASNNPASTCSEFTNADMLIANQGSLLPGQIPASPAMHAGTWGFATGTQNTPCIPSQCHPGSFSGLLTALQSATLTSLFVGNPCAATIFAMMWQLGDFNNPASRPGTTGWSPTANPTLAGYIVSKFGSDIATRDTNAKLFFNGQAISACSALPAPSPTNLNLGGAPQASIAACQDMYLLNIKGTYEGATGDTEAAQETFKTLGGVLAQFYPTLGSPLDQLDALAAAPTPSRGSAYTRTLRDTKYREVLLQCGSWNGVDGRCDAPLLSATVAIANRHLVRPSAALANTDAKLLKILSTNTHDLPAASFRTAVFGGTVPEDMSLSGVHGGKCQCAPSGGPVPIAGARCTQKEDGLCGRVVSDANLISALFEGCVGYIACGDLTQLKLLATKATGLAQAGSIAPADAQKIAILPNIFAVGTAFGYNQVAAAPVLLGECARYLPCLETQALPAEIDNVAVLPPAWAAVFSSSASFATFTALDIATWAEVVKTYVLAPVPSPIPLGVSAIYTKLWGYRAGLYFRATATYFGVKVQEWVGLGNSVPTSQGLALNDVATLLTPFSTDANADLAGVLLPCFASPATPCTTPFVSSTFNDGPTVCPVLTNFMGATPITNFEMFFHCLAEWAHASASATGSLDTSNNRFTRGSSAQAIWGSNAVVKGAMCAGGEAIVPAAGHMSEASCKIALAGFAVSAISSLLAPTPAGTIVTLAALDDLNGAQAAPVALSFSQLSNLQQQFAVAQSPFPTYFNTLMAASFVNASVQDTQTRATMAVACTAATTPPSPAYVTPTSIYPSDCVTVFNNVGGALEEVPASIDNIATAVGKYTFVATALGACNTTSPTGGVAYGGADCWLDSECGEGICNVTSTVPVPFTKITAFASIVLTTMPRGMVKKWNQTETKLYRARANQAILDRYNATFGNLSYTGLATQGSTPMDMTIAERVLRKWRKQAGFAMQVYKNNLTATGSAGRRRQLREGGGRELVTSVNWLSDDAGEDTVSDFSAGDAGIIILGYVLMGIYAQITLASWSTDKATLFNASRGQVAILGVILVAFSVASGLGITLLAGYEWSAAATQVIPFVMLALGVSDVFVMIRCFPLYRDGVSAADAAAKGLALAGPSMFIVACTNAGVFAIGVLTGMPVVQTFAVQAAIITATNYVTVNTVFPVLLCVDYKRQGAGRAECFPWCSVGRAVQPEAKENEVVDRNCFNRWFVPAYGNFLMSGPGKLLALCVIVAFVIAGAVGVTSAQLGLLLSEVAPAGSSVANALAVRDKYFPFYNVYLYTGQADYSKVEVQQGVVNLYTQFNTVSKVVAGSATCWMQAFQLWGSPSTPLYDQTGFNEDGSARICNAQSSTTGGQCGQNFGCVILTNANGPYFNSTDFYRCLQLWVNIDVTYDAISVGLKLVDPDAGKPNRVLYFVPGTQYDLPISTGSYVAQKLSVNQDYVDLIAESNAIVGPDTTPPSFVGGTPIQYWDQYTSLMSTIKTAIGYSLLLCFLILFWGIWVLAESGESGFCKKMVAAFWASALVTGIIAMIVFELFGFMVWANLQISAIPAISIIMSTGVAVEYTCYISIAFVNAPGTRSERAKRALDIMFAPTVDGAATMLLGVLLLAASPFTFIVKYFFYVWILMIWFGVFNGVVAVPVIMSLIGPFAINSGTGRAVTDLQSKQ